MIRHLRNLAFFLESSYWEIRARCQFALRGIRWPDKLKVYGKLGLSARGSLVLGKNIRINNDSRYNRAGINHPTQIVVGPNARLEIGNHAGISGSVIYCTERIEIGDHVMLGANSKIYDTDFHPLDAARRRSKEPGPTAPVKIGDDVWLCANVTVLKGVTIGDRSVVAAGSLVTRNIPADCLAAGMPARVIRHINAADPAVGLTTDQEE